MPEDKFSLDDEYLESYQKHDIDRITEAMDVKAKAIEESEDKEEPMTFERKLYMISKLFPIELGSRVRNKLGEDGIVEMVGIDHRGVLYLVLYKDQNTKWESEAQIKQITSYGSSPSAKNNIKPKTDIPDPGKE